MTSQQKMAWFQFWVVTSAAALVLALWPFLGKGAAGALGLTGLLGFNYVFMKPRRKGELQWDERERQIGLQANLVAYSIFWIYFVGACMIPWMLCEHRGETTIPVEYLPCMLVFGYMMLSLLQAAAILVQYRGERPDQAQS